MIKIEESKKEGYKPTLKFKELLDGEYVIISWTSEFDEPMTGSGEYKGKKFDWSLYDITVHEFNRIDLAQMKHDLQKPEQNCSYFASGNVKKALEAHPHETKIKFTMVENDKGKRIYKAEVVGDAPASATPAPAKTEELSLEQTLKNLKTAGVDFGVAFGIVSAKYDTTEAQAKALFEVL